MSLTVFPVTVLPMTSAAVAPLTAYRTIPYLSWAVTSLLSMTL